MAVMRNFFPFVTTIDKVHQSPSCLQDDSMDRNVNVAWSNVNCERDIFNTLIWNRRILRVLGIWPLVYPYTTTIEKAFATFSFAFCWSALSFLLIPMIIYMLSSQNSMRDKIKMLGAVSNVFVQTLKYFLLVVHYKSIRQCIRVVSVDWRAIQQEEHREIMIKDMTKGHVLSKLCITFMYGAGLCFHTVMPFLMHRPLDELNNTVRAIPYPGFDTVFNMNVMSIYVFVFCAQWLGSIVLFNVTTGACSLAIMLVSHTCGQMDVVMARLESLMKRDTQNNYANPEQRMAIIVRQHVQTLRFSASIENILNEICLVEVVGSTVVICMLEYYCLTEWQNNDSISILSYFLLLISFVFNAFIYCYIGEQLTDQSSKVGNSSYKIKWYHLRGKNALDLTLLINMSHHPIKITAGKLITLSFSSFGNILKTTIAYFNMLRTFD